MNPLSYATDNLGREPPCGRGQGAPLTLPPGGQMTVEGKDSRSRTLTLGGVLLGGGPSYVPLPIKGQWHPHM